VRLREGRDDADERLSARLRLRGLPVASPTALRRLLRVLLVCGSRLSAEAGRRRLRLAEALTLDVKAGLVLGRDRRVKAPRNVPTKGAAQGAALADALRRTAATPARRVVEPFDYGHGKSLRPKGGWSGSRQRPRSTPPCPRRSVRLTGNRKLAKVSKEIERPEGGRGISAESLDSLRRPPASVIQFQVRRASNIRELWWG
jgi:hypothetical protein